jgi:hypothetical protein
LSSRSEIAADIAAIARLAKIKNLRQRHILVFSTPC